MTSIQPSSSELTVWHDVGVTVTDRRVIVGTRSYRREEIKTAVVTFVPANRRPAIIMAIVAASVFVMFAGGTVTLKSLAPLTLFIPAVLLWTSAKARYVVHVFTADGPVEVFSSDRREAAQQLTDLLVSRAGPALGAP